MNKVELEGTIYSYGVSADNVEICIKTQDGPANTFHRVVAIMPRCEIVKMAVGKCIHIEGSLRSVPMSGVDRLDVYVMANNVQVL